MNSSRNLLHIKTDILEPDAKVLKLTKVLSEMDEALNSTLHPRKTKVTLFEYHRCIAFHLPANQSLIKQSMNCSINSTSSKDLLI